MASTFRVISCGKRGSCFLGIETIHQFTRTQHEMELVKIERFNAETSDEARLELRNLTRGTDFSLCCPKQEETFVQNNPTHTD